MRALSRKVLFGTYVPPPKPTLLFSGSFCGGNGADTGVPFCFLDSLSDLDACDMKCTEIPGCIAVTWKASDLYCYLHTLTDPGSSLCPGSYVGPSLLPATADTCDDIIDNVPSTGFECYCRSAE